MINPLNGTPKYVEMFIVRREMCSSDWSRGHHDLHVNITNQLKDDLSSWDLSEQIAIQC
jgi:hypothetical protein